MSVLEDAFSAFISTYMKFIPNEAMNEILNLRCQALDLQRDNDILADENRKLKSKMDDLKKEIEKKEALHRKGNAYFVNDDNGEEIGPICYECYKKTGGVYFLEQTNGGARCSICKKRYVDVKTEHVGYVQQARSGW